MAKKATKLSPSQKAEAERDQDLRKRCLELAISNKPSALYSSNIYSSNPPPPGSYDAISEARKFFSFIKGT